MYDDVKLCLQYKDISRHLDLESDLEPTKRKVMIFCPVNPIYTTCRITRVDDLGVLLDPKLKFSHHISTLVNKVRGVLGLKKKGGPRNLMILTRLKPYLFR